MIWRTERFFPNLGLILLLLTAGVYPQDKTYSEWYLQRSDTDIYVRDEGRGKDVVVVLHGGFGANHQYMLDATQGLGSRFRLVFFDQRGSLLSPAAKENLTFQKNVDDLYALVRALKVNKVKLFAHSMGTLVAMEFMKQHPDLVSNAVLVGAIFAKAETSKSVFSERMGRQVAELQSRKEVQDLLRPYKNNKYDELRSIDDIEKSRLTHKDLTVAWRIKYASINIFDIQKHDLVKGGRAFYKGEASVMSDTVNWKYDYRTVLSDNGKTTLIQGDHDFLDFYAEEHSKLLKDYPSIKIDLVRNAGHNIWIDRPSEFKRLLRAGLLR